MIPSLRNMVAAAALVRAELAASQVLAAAPDTACNPGPGTYPVHVWAVAGGSQPLAEAAAPMLQATPGGIRTFPEALKTLAEVDPELHSIIEDEKRRQWYARGAGAQLRQLLENSCGAGGGGGPCKLAAPPAATVWGLEPCLLPDALLQPWVQPGDNTALRHKP